MVVSLYWSTGLFIIKCAHKKSEKTIQIAQRGQKTPLTDRLIKRRMLTQCPSGRHAQDQKHSELSLQIWFFWSSVPEGKDERSYRERHFTVWYLNCHGVSKPFLRWPNTNTVVYLGVCINKTLNTASNPPYLYQLSPKSTKNKRRKSTPYTFSH